MVDLDPTRGREQSGLRPALVLSVDKFNHGPAELVIMVPITKTKRGIFITCEELRSVSTDRLVRQLGNVTDPRIEGGERYVRLLLGL